MVGNNATLNDYTTISNNIIANTGFNCGPSGCIGAVRMYSSDGCGPHNVYANNLMYGNAGGNYVFDSCSDTSTGTQTGSNSTTFVNYTGTISGDYHLKAGSTAINAGTTACALTGCVPTTDITGKARPNPPSIGAYEP